MTRMECQPRPETSIEPETVGTKNRVDFWAWIWTVALLVLCWAPSGWLFPEANLAGPRFFEQSDKVIHLSLFAGFAFLWGWAGGRKRLVKVLVGGLALAALTEAGQGLPFIARDPDLFDALADGVGVIVGLAVVVGVFRR